jgi:predicted ribosomally synthesized peptide with nif11-like leader
MSKENVARFIKAIAEQPELNKKVASAEKSTPQWVALGNQSGYQFSNNDFVDFVKQVTGSDADNSNAVSVLLQSGQEMNDQQLDQVAGGVLSYSSLSFSPQLFTSMSSLYDIGGISASFVRTSGPSFVKS